MKVVISVVWLTCQLMVTLAYAVEIEHHFAALDEIESMDSRDGIIGIAATRKLVVLSNAGAIMADMPEEIPQDRFVNIAVADQSLLYLGPFGWEEGEMCRFYKAEIGPEGEITMTDITGDLVSWRYSSIAAGGTSRNG